jgi:DNA-binding PadR family transcriptional regulator
MKKDALLGQSELLVMLAVLRLGREAYGVPISREISKQAGRNVAVAGIYSTLERLEDKGLIKASVREPTAVRGGRAKTCFQLTAEGLRKVRSSQRTLERFWSGIRELEALKR